MEILVALAIISILFSALFGVFSRIAQTADQAQTELNLGQVGRMLCSQVSQDLEDVYLVKGEKETGANNASSAAWAEFTGNSPDPDTMETTVLLSMATFSALDFSNSGTGNPETRTDKLVRVRYLVQPLSNHLYQLIREEMSYPELEQPPSATSIVLTKNLATILIRFSTATGQELHSWNKDKIPLDKMQLKYLVIAFTLQDKEQKKTFYIGKAF